MERMRQWKSEHESRLCSLLGVKACDTRAEALVELRGLLASGEIVHATYGAGSPASGQAESGDTWRREVAEVMLPNNTKVSALFEVYAGLLRADEFATVGESDPRRRGLYARIWVWTWAWPHHGFRVRWREFLRRIQARGGGLMAHSVFENQPGQQNQDFPLSRLGTSAT